MIASSLQDALATSDPATITSGAIIFMVAFAVVAAMARIASLMPRLTAQTPTLLTSFGILGTFAGIVIGLHGFSADADRIDASIGVLLSGLDVAFTSSLVGMALAILFKLLEAFLPEKGHAAQVSEDPVLAIAQATQATVEELARLRQSIGAESDGNLSEQLTKTTEQLHELCSGAVKSRKLAQRQVEVLERLDSALVEDDDSSVAGQLRNLLREFSDGRKEARKATETAADIRARLLELGERGLVETQNATVAAQASANSIQNASDEARESGHVMQTALPAITVLLERVATEQDVLTGVVRDTAERTFTEGEQRHTQHSRLAEATIDTLQNIDIALGSSGGVVTTLGEVRSAIGTLDQAQRVGTREVADELSRQTTVQREIASVAESATSTVQRSGVELAERLDEVVKLLARSPTEEIIDALKATIREFNEHIAEQFGENFARLNDAVGDLLRWQDEHRQHLAEMTAQYDRSVQAVESSERSVRAIAEHGEVIPEQMQSLGRILAANDAQIADIGAHLGAFADVRDRAVEAVPEIAGVVNATVAELLASSQQLTRGVHSSVEGLTQGIQESATRHAESMKSVDADVRAIAQRTRDESQRLFDSLEASISESYRLAAEGTEQLVTKEFGDMEKLRTAQVEKVMNEMGTALATITRAFTEDYERLVKAMEQVVRRGGDWPDAA